MTFEPTEMQALVAKTARDFAARELRPRAAERDRKATFPVEEMRTLGTLGLLGVCVPEEFGGAAAGPVALAMTIAEVAHADASVAVTMAVTNMVAEILAQFGSDTVKRQFLPDVCSGAAVAASFALSEAQAGSDAGAIGTLAVRRDGGYLLRGSKLWITSGDRAGVLVVMARHADDAGTAKDATSAGAKPGADEARSRISAFVVPGGAPGLSAGRHERKMGQRGSSTVALALDDVFVADSHRLGAEGDGFKVAMTALDGGRIGVGAQAVGIGRAALDASLAYARQRRQFGARLADFQAIQFMLADSAIALDAAWLLVLAAASGKERGVAFSRTAAQAKLLASEKAVEVCDRAIQIHGGYGYTREFPVERLFRDVRVTTIYEGTSQIQRLVIARHLLREAAHA